MFTLIALLHLSRMLSMRTNSPTPAIEIQPSHYTSTSMFHCRFQIFDLEFLISFTPDHFTPVWSEKIKFAFISKYYIIPLRLIFQNKFFSESQSLLSILLVYIRLDKCKYLNILKQNLIKSAVNMNTWYF